MNRIFTLIASVAFSAASFAQVGAVAPDFTVTDLDGVTHDLSDMLGDGKVVILDASATWCPPCWGFHNAHFLEDIHNTYGPSGTDEVRVLFYEADAATTLADLQGTGTNTQGDWLTGSSYPFINESPITLSGAVYWPLGFPTINVISPTDGKITADLWDSYNPSDLPGSLVAMEAIIEAAKPQAAIVENAAGAVSFSVFPNPSNGNMTVQFTSDNNSEVTVNVVNLLGQTVFTNVEGVTTGTNNLALDFTSVENGNYILQVIDGENTVVNTKIQLNK